LAAEPAPPEKKRFPGRAATEWHGACCHALQHYSAQEIFAGRAGPAMCVFLIWVVGEDAQVWRTTSNHTAVNQTDLKLAPREQQIAALLLQGCDNAEIAQELNIARRTVKAHFNRMFQRFGIRSGIKRVKLATLLYRRLECSPNPVTEAAFPVGENSPSLNSLLKD
jgi:DNA-binding CsgD family transcriptional regulator